MSVFVIERSLGGQWQPVFIGNDWHSAFESIESVKKEGFKFRGSIWRDGKFLANIDFGN